MQIPKKITTAWFSENGYMPDLVKKCIASQKIEGYEHKVITLEDLPKDNKYINECLANPHGNKKWVKLTDYVRMLTLLEGGWFCDADLEFTSKDKRSQELRSDLKLEDNPEYKLQDTLSQFENEQFVIGEEGCETIANGIVLGVAIIGSVPDHPLVKAWIHEVETRFSGLDDKCYESSMDIINSIGPAYQNKVTILPKDYFYPYDHQKDELKITDNTVAIHWFNRSWLGPSIPTTETVDIIIPHLGANREQGLRDLMDSIGKLNYPMDLVSIRIMDGEDSVPVKVKEGVELSNSKYIVFAANDMTFDKECIRNAIEYSKEFNKSLVSFNEGFLLPDEGNICTHFLVKRGFLPLLENGEIFSTDFNHVGCDNYLWAQASKLGEAAWCENARITHNHFSKTNNYDSTYEKGWKNAEQDRITLKEKLAKLAST